MYATKREIIISISIILIAIAGMLAITFSVSNSYIDKNQKYDTALLVEKERFDYALDTSPGHAFIHADITASNLVSLPELKDNFVYIHRVKQTWDYVRKSRTETYKCGKNTCTRIVYYWVWEWVTHDRVTLHSDKLLINGYEVEYNEIVGIQDYDLKLSLDMFETTSIDGKEIYEITGWDDTYIEVGNGGIFNSNDTRYYYKVIRPEDIINGSMFVRFTDRIMEPDDSSKFRFYEMDAGELSKTLHKSPVGWYVLIWLLGSTITGFLVYGFYYLDNHWLHDETTTTL